MAKFPHAAVHYGPGKPNAHCSICKHYQPDGPHCAIVVDPIFPDGWCEKFEAKMTRQPMPQPAAPNPQAAAPQPGIRQGQHPRMHALTIAAANHLHRAGHLPAAEADRIRKHARGQLKATKAARPQAQAQAQPQPFGALAPDTDQDYR